MNNTHPTMPELKPCPATSLDEVGVPCEYVGHSIEYSKGWIAGVNATKKAVALLATTLQKRVEDLEDVCKTLDVIYDELMKAAPWSESNDMDKIDEFSCGLTGLIQDRDQLQSRCRELESDKSMILSELKGCMYGLSTHPTTMSHDGFCISEKSKEKMNCINEVINRYDTSINQHKGDKV